MNALAHFRAALWSVLAILVGGAAFGQSVVTDVGTFANDVRNYNLITLGNATLSGSSDTQGGIAIGGNLTFGGSWTIASNVGTGSATDPSLYVNGQMTLSGTDYLNNGYASTPNLTGSWNWNSGQKNFTGGGGTLHINASDSSYDSSSPKTNPAPSGWNWTTLASSFNSISSGLAAATPTGTIAVSGGNLNFNSSATSGVVVFDLDASKLSGATYNGSSFSNIQISVPTGVNYVINVLNLCDGQTLFGSGVNFNSGTNDDELLWNFSQTTNVNVSLGGNFYGAILAPDVNITDSTTINGQVVADSFTDNGVELHDTDFVPVAGLVPEPRTFALWTLALCGAMVLGGRWILNSFRRAGP